MIAFAVICRQHSAEHTESGTHSPANRWRSEKELALTTRICQLILLPFQIRSSKQSVGFFHSVAAACCRCCCYGCSCHHQHSVTSLELLTLGSFTLFLSTCTHWYWYWWCIYRTQTRTHTQPYTHRQPTHIFQVFSLVVFFVATSFEEKENRLFYFIS